jgi:hypothetical protein
MRDEMRPCCCAGSAPEEGGGEFRVRVRVLEGVGVAEFGVRDDREPLLGDAFEADQRLSW